MKRILIAGLLAFPLICNAVSLDETIAAAVKGDVKAQVELGLMHTEGRGAAKDYSQAMEWFKILMRYLSR